MNKYQIGQIVHVNKDDIQWGRIAEDATIIEVRTKSLLVNCHNLRANVIVLKSQVTIR